MSDITVTINPPQTTSITVGGGVLPHNFSHSPAGSDSLETWYATVNDLAYVSGQIGAPAGVVFTTGDQNISGVKNFYSRPTVNGSGVMLTGETAGTGYLTGYVSKSETGLFVSSVNTGSFVTTSQTGQLTGVFYPYSANPAAYIQGAVVRPSNTGNFADLGSTQTISGQKTFTKIITAPTGFFGVNNTFGNFVGQVMAGGENNSVSGDYSTVGGGELNLVINSNHATIVGGNSNRIESSDESSIGGGNGNNIRASSSSVINGGGLNLISGGSSNAVFGSEHIITNSDASFAFGVNSTITNSDAAFSVGPGNTLSGADNALVLSAYATSSSGSSTAILAYDSGIYLNGPTHFDNRPQVSGIGFQTTGEYAKFNLWDEFSGALYPYPKNALNRSYNIQKRAENNSGPSGETIWFNLPQWTGEKPIGTGISSFYNTGFWARDYDWSCVSFKGVRTNSGNPSSPLTLISPRHALGVAHAGDSPGAKCAFVSNVETGYTWEATIASTTTLSGDARLYTFTSDAPSQIRPASIIGSSPTPSWQTASLSSTRALTVKNSTVLFDILGGISSGAGFQAGSLIVGHTPDPGARYTGAHVGGDSASPVFIPLDDGRLVYVGGASTASSVAFVGDPAIRSGIGFATSGYSVDTWNVPETQVSGIFPVSGQLSRIGGPTNKWSAVYSENVHANNLYGDLGEYEVYSYNEYLYGGPLTANPTDFHGLTFNTEEVADLNTINFSGTYPDTFWSRFVIPNSGASFNFSSSGPTLLMPNGSGFSGVGYVIEARGMGNNKLLIQPISVPSGTYGGGTTGYLTGYVNKSETGDFYPRSNPSGYVTGVDLSPCVPYNGATGTVNLGTQSLITHSVKADSSDGLILASNNGTTGIVVGAGGSANTTVYGSLKLDYTTASKVPAFDSLKNLIASNVTTGELNYLTGVTSSIQTQFDSITNSTGAFLTTGAADLRYVGLTGGQNVSGVKNFVSRPTVGGTGVMLSGESSPVTLQAAYDNSSTTEILTDSTRGAFSLKRGSAADTDAVFEVINNTGVSTFSTKGNGETTLTLNSAAGVIGTGLILSNTTPATVGNQCLSPRFVLSSHGWKTTATAGSQRFDWGVHSLPVQGTSAPDGTLVFGTSVNSGAYTDAMHLYTEGSVKYRGLAFPGAFTLGISTTSQTNYMYMAGNGLFLVFGSNQKQAMNNAGDYSTVSAGTYGWSDLKLARDGANILAQVNGTGSQTFRIYGTTTGSKYLSLAHDGTNAVISASSGNVTITTPTSLSSSLAANGAFISTPQALSGAGAVNITTLITKITSTGVGDALTLADGVDGQMKIIAHVVDGGSAVLTPTTKTGFTTITFTNAGESATLIFYTTVGWMIQSLYGAVAA